LLQSINPSQRYGVGKVLFPLNCGGRDDRMNHVITITEVADIDNIDVYASAGNEHYFICPMCQGKHKRANKKCSFNPTKGNTRDGVVQGAWKCFYGHGGGPVDLHMAVTGISDYKEAVKDLLGDNHTSPLNGATSANHYEAVPEQPSVPIERRDRVYKALLKILTLSQQDFENFLEPRGYSYERAVRYGYRSLPLSWKARTRVIDELKKADIDTDGIPGFCQYEGKDATITTSNFRYRLKETFVDIDEDGHVIKKRCYDDVANPESRFTVLLIPVYDIHCRLAFFQLGWDKRISGKYLVSVDADGIAETDEFGKYTAFSTKNAPHGGTIYMEPGIVSPHWGRDQNGDLIPLLGDQNWVTVVEGTLKTPLYFEMSGHRETCISRPGVGSALPGTLKMLRELKRANQQLTTVIEAYDMDKFSNVYVCKASIALQRAVEQMGFKFIIRAWNPKYKGIDDFEYARLKGEDVGTFRYFTRVYMDTNGKYLDNPLYYPL